MDSQDLRIRRVAIDTWRDHLFHPVHLSCDCTVLHAEGCGCERAPGGDGLFDESHPVRPSLGWAITGSLAFPAR